MAQTPIFSDFVDVDITPSIRVQVRGGERTYISTAGRLTQEELDRMREVLEEQLAALSEVPVDPPLQDELREDYSKRGMGEFRPGVGSVGEVVADDAMVAERNEKRRAERDERERSEQERRTRRDRRFADTEEERRGDARA